MTTYFLLIITFLLSMVVVMKFFRAIHINLNSLEQSKSNSSTKKASRSFDSIHLIESTMSGIEKSIKDGTSKDYSKTTKGNLTLIEDMKRGKSSSIWKGHFNDSHVLVKILNESDPDDWCNELRIYSLPLMRHPSLPKFYTNIDRFDENIPIERCFIIEYGQNGSLQSFLKANTFDWSKMCKIYDSLAQGLAFLHTEFRNESRVKPSIAHCDLCSSNIVIKADGETCMICDFQSAVPFLSGTNSATVSNRLKSIRYLAPEILDNTINLRQLECSLKQADIYALGLIFWEIATRCVDLYQGIDALRYKLPFEHELCVEPTFEQMKSLVCRHKARPLFPDIWKDTNHAIRLLKETISECWDNDPEARLTASCIEERMHELPILWRRFKLEASNCRAMRILKEHLHRKNAMNQSQEDILKISILRKLNQLDTLNEKENKLNDCYINEFGNSMLFQNHRLQSNQHFRRDDCLNSTIEPDWTKNEAKFSNSIIGHHKNINNENNSRKNDQPELSLPLQPYNARNPCLERNLMISNDNDDYSCSKNCAVCQSMKQGIKFQHQNSDIKINLGTASSSENYSSNNFDSENQSLLSSSLPIHPIPIPIIQNKISQMQNESNSVKKQYSSTFSSARIKDINKYRNRTSCFIRNSNRKQSFLALILRKAGFDTEKNASLSEKIPQSLLY
ncbi:putative malonyl CoA-acyl carrier protein transacylase [Sarcoptes scabiei]|nr:putative malonyl CoA-acyl carrier protein transacylase [Sarcoptes scabiei]